MNQTFDIGDLVTLRGGFTNRPLTQAERDTFLANGTLPTGVGVTPGDVVCTVRKPDGTTATPAVTEAGGIASADITIDQHGPWWYAFDGTGGHQASGERRLDVRQRRVPRS